MSQAIGHFAIGVAGAFLLLIWNPRFLRRFINIKNDLFFVGLSGLWALIPDWDLVLGPRTSSFFNTASYHLFYSGWGNIFWFHTYLDKVVDLTDSTMMSTIFIAIALVFGYLYYLKIKGRLGIRLPGGT